MSADPWTEEDYVGLQRVADKWRAQAQWEQDKKKSGALNGLASTVETIIHSHRKWVRGEKD